MSKKDIFSEQITVDGELYDYHVSHDCIVIREATGKAGEKRGWKHFAKFPKKDAAVAQYEWKKMYERRYVTASELVGQAEDHEKNRKKFLASERENSAVAVVEKGKTDTMSVLLTVAAQINEKVERFQVVEKEATMIMLEVGLGIEYVKEQLPHGQLQKWMSANLTISHRHARRFSELARVFIKANSLKNDECLLLCDPANSKEALGEKLRQMAFDFLGDKTQAELFEQYKIKYQEPKKLTYHPPKGGEELPPGESREHLVAIHTWNELGESISRNGLDQESWAYLTTKERQGLYDIVNELATRLRKSLKK